MTCTLRPLLAALGLALAGGLHAAEPAGPPPSTGPKLEEREILSAVKIDAVTIPAPGELLAAIDKLGKPDWASAARPPIATSYSSRPQMALNIGGLIADGFIAVEAKDAQQVKNIGHDIIALARSLAVPQDILNRGKSVTDFAERGEWDALKEDLEATENEVKEAMAGIKDEDLITLVTLGGWIRGIDAMANYVNNHYSPEGAKLLRQPAIAHFLSERLNAMPNRVRDDDAVRQVRTGMMAIEQSVSFPSSTVPAPEAVHDLAAATTDLLKDLVHKK